MSKVTKRDNNNKYKIETKAHNADIKNKFLSVDLGDIEAEKDENIDQYFIDSPTYHELANLTKATCVLVGEKGSGKSALLKKLSLCTHRDEYLWMSNTDLDILAMQKKLQEYFTDEDFKEKRLAFKFIWEFIIYSQVLQHFFNKKNFFDQVKTKYGNEEFKSLNEFFQITKHSNSLNFYLNGALKFMSPQMPIGCSIEGEIGKKQNSANQEINNTKILHDLMQTMGNFGRNIDNYITGDKLFLFIDDLDSSWDNSNFAKFYIEGLIDAIYYINKKSSLKVVITLLDSVFNSIELRNRDKIDNNYAKKIRWDKNTCEELINKRLLYNDLKFEDIFTNDIIFADVYKYTTGIPRDIIKFFNFCITAFIEGSGKINQKQLKILVDNYADTRIQELLSNASSQYSIDIKPIINELKGGKRMFSYNKLSSRLNKIFEMYESQETPNYKLKNLLTYKGKNTESLIQILYKLGFIGFSSHSERTTGIFVNELPEHEINEKYHYIIRNLYASAMSLK